MSSGNGGRTKRTARLEALRVMPKRGLRIPSGAGKWVAIGVVVWSIASYLSDVRTAFIQDLSTNDRLAVAFSSLGASAALIAVALRLRWTAVWCVALCAAAQVGDIVLLQSGKGAVVRTALMLSAIIVAGAAAVVADRRVAASTLALYVATKALFISDQPDQTGPVLFAELPAVAFLVALAWVVGGAVRRRQAAELRVMELAEQAQLARDRERSLLARELHDVVAHELTIIAMQATLMRMSTDEAEIATARSVIEQTSRRALDELKRLLMVLRTNDAPPDSTSAQQASVATVVDGVADQLRALGHEVEASCRCGEMPRSVELAADRVLRESATNIVKHSPERSRVWIEVVGDGEALGLEVANELGGPSSPRGALKSTRLGLPGLQERLSLLGGVFAAGIEADRWVVRARIPYRPQTDASPSA